jgi:hypothetical protein
MIEYLTLLGQYHSMSLNHYTHKRKEIVLRTQAGAPLACQIQFGSLLDRSNVISMDYFSLVFLIVFASKFSYQTLFDNNRPCWLLLSFMQNICSSS